MLMKLPLKQETKQVGICFRVVFEYLLKYKHADK